MNMEALQQSPWLGYAVIAAAIVGLIWQNRGYLAHQGKRLVSLVPGRKEATPSDEQKLAALKLLCPHYRNDPEGHAALQVLKARFLLVPGASE